VAERVGLLRCWGAGIGLGGMRDVESGVLRRGYAEMPLLSGASSFREQTGMH
jgi:hypothetical protein